MKKFVPYEKLSKSKKRELDRKKRVTWRNVKPVTRKVESKKHYKRKSRNFTDYSDGFGTFTFYSRLTIHAIKAFAYYIDINLINHTAQRFCADTMNISGVFI
ncbi:MAG: hypothetical protein U0L70_05105 [Ruminococcus sp.]|nr:hypothetical protein [Ruminococcus sp.]